MLSSVLGCGLLAQGNPSPEIQSKIASGIELLKSGDLDNAERAFNSLLTQGAKSAPVFHNLGVIAQYDKDTKVAVEHYKRALALDPAFEPALYNYGVIKYRANGIG